MGVILSLAQLSDHLMIVTVVLYSLAMLAFAAQIAYGRQGRRARSRPRQVLVTVGAGAGAGEEAAPARDTGPTPAVAGGRRASARLAVALTVLGASTHLSEIITRGLAAHRVPWGNMYEFSSGITFGAVVVLLVVMWRYRAAFLGLFVLIPVVLLLGVASTALYTPAGPLMPALRSYWIAIHVTAAIIATGAFTVAGTANVLYLLITRHDRLVAQGREVGWSRLARRLPGADVLDRLAYRTVVFGFPIWTFAIVAGALWADEAWGRYWGWDPKETWSFITWVVYAGFLHARSTAGWRGRRAAYISLAAFLCLLFNFFGINFLVSGMHSYA